MHIVRTTPEEIRKQKERIEKEFPLTVTAEIKSNSTKNKQPIYYAHTGDRVRLISDCGNVLIVENVKGLRFPAATEFINKANDQDQN